MEGQPVLKAVFHVDEPEKLEMALGNVRNLLAYYAQRDIEHRTEIVLNGRAVLALVRDSEASADNAEVLRDLSGQGVRVAACGNALRSLFIDPGSLHPFARVVPAGVAELVIRQAEGYAYIRP